MNILLPFFLPFLQICACIVISMLVVAIGYHLATMLMDDINERRENNKK